MRIKRLVIRFSWAGLCASFLFLALAVGVFGWVFFVASKNPADSGESGILLLPFAMPWIMLLPSGWVSPLTGIASIALNAVLVYLVFGGLRIDRKKQAGP